MDLDELKLDGFLYTAALADAISEMDWRKIGLVAPQALLNAKIAADNQVMLINGYLTEPVATVDPQLEVTDKNPKEQVRVMTNLAGPLFEVPFLQRNGTTSDMRQDVLNFPLLPCNPLWNNTISTIIGPFFKSRKTSSKRTNSY